MSWPLPPACSWPQFLRLLRRADAPASWLEVASTLKELQRRPLLLRWIAQHRRCPTHLRASLLPRLPWKALAVLALDASAHPQAAAFAVEKLRVLWPSLSTGERRVMAMLAPRPLWPLVWKARDAGVLQAFLQHPRLTLDFVVALVQAPLQPSQAEALQACRWRDVPALARQVLEALDHTMATPDHALVLGMAAPWIKALEPEERLDVASRLAFPPLRRMVRAWAGGTSREALGLD